eukprot:NODE_534_length_6366_cov_0.490825.p3 type:complete len:148 gc:universal NODE_534_length_6366_cov_0.490825:1785-2228(+)
MSLNKFFKIKDFEYGQLCATQAQLEGTLYSIEAKMEAELEIFTSDIGEIPNTTKETSQMKKELEAKYGSIIARLNKNIGAAKVELNQLKIDAIMLMEMGMDKEMVIRTISTPNTTLEGLNLVHLARSQKLKDGTMFWGCFSKHGKTR